MRAQLTEAHTHIRQVYDEDKESVAMGDWVGDEGEVDEIDVEATSVESSPNPSPSTLNDEEAEAFEAAKALEVSAELNFVPPYDSVLHRVISTM